jgi:hypothetical protein
MQRRSIGWVALAVGGIEMHRTALGTYVYSAEKEYIR